MTPTPHRFVRRLLAGAAVSMALALAPLSAMADFSGAYAPAQWTTTLLGTPAGGGGSVDTSGAPASIKIVGGDDGCSSEGGEGGPETICEVRYTTTAQAASAVHFDWAYTTVDSDGPSYDVFLVVNGVVQTTLSNSDGATTQNGTHSFNVAAGQTFGFALNCSDCTSGLAEVVISNFSASAVAPANPVPTLSEWALALLAALMAVSAGKLLRKRRIG